jgi:hypothetical protein
MKPIQLIKKLNIKSSRFSKMREVVSRAVKSARYLALLGKARAFDKTDQNYTNLKARAFSGQKCGISRAFWFENDQNYGHCIIYTA